MLSWGQAHDRPRRSTSTLPRAGPRSGAQLHKFWARLHAAHNEDGAAARFLAVLAVELAEPRHAAASPHLTKPTASRQNIATFDFRPCHLARARIEALAKRRLAGRRSATDRFGNSHRQDAILCAIRSRLVEAGNRVFYTGQRPGAAAQGCKARSRSRSGPRKLDQVRPDHPRRHHYAHRIG